MEKALNPGRKQLVTTVSSGWYSDLQVVHLSETVDPFLRQQTGRHLVWKLVRRRGPSGIVAA